MKKIIVSNNVHKLRQAFKKFYKQSKEQKFFNEQYLIYDKQAHKNSLQLDLADDENFQVAMDLNYIRSNSLLFFLQKILKIDFEKAFPGFLELGFKIEDEINKILKYPSNAILLQPLFDYLDDNDKKREQKIIDLKSELVEFFYNKAVYNEKGDKTNTWHQYLFNSIFSKQVFPNISLDEIDFSKMKDCYLHIFLLPHIPGTLFKIIEKLPNVIFYHLSPTSYYIEDLLSDYERTKIDQYWQNRKASLKTRLELSEYLKDRNAYLANLASLKRQYFKYALSDAFEIIEEYDQEIDPLKWQEADVLQQKSLAQSVKNDFLYFRNPDNSKKIDHAAFSDIEIEEASSKIREIEILANNILKKMYEERALLKDICVLAPDIDSYVPYINMIFAREPALKYKIHNLKAFSHSKIAAGFLKILELKTNNWEKREICGLLQNEYFLFHEISREEREELIGLIEGLNVTWGVDSTDREKQIANLENIYRGDLSKGTWFEGMQKLLSGFIYFNGAPHDNSEINFPISKIEIKPSQMELIGKFIKVINGLREDLSIVCGNTQMTCQEWQKYLRMLFFKYFSITLNNSYTENVFVQVISSFFSKLNSITNQSRFTFLSIASELKQELLRKEVTLFPSSENVINFYSIRDGAGAFDRHIFLIGMGDSYPKNRILNAISVLEVNAPAEMQFKRDNFLDILLTAENLTISYVNKEKNEPPSIFASELLAYLDKAFTVDGKEVSNKIFKKHASYGFHRKYFSEDSLVNYLHDYDELARYYFERPAIYTTEKKEIIKAKSDVQVITIEQIRRFAEHPIRYYLNSHLGIYLEKAFEEEMLGIGEYRKTYLARQLLKKPLDQLFVSLRRSGQIASYFNDEIDRDEILEEAQLFSKSLNYFNVRQNEIVDVTIAKVEKVELNDCYIAGIIEQVSKKGMLVFQEKSEELLFRIWPIFLLYLKYFPEKEKKILFLRDREQLELDFDHEMALERYLSLYLKTSNKLSLYMHPRFLKYYLKEDMDGLYKAVDRLYEGKDFYQDEYLLRVYKTKEQMKEGLEKSANLNMKEIFFPLLELI